MIKKRFAFSLHLLVVIFFMSQISCQRKNYPSKSADAFLEVDLNTYLKQAYAYAKAKQLDSAILIYDKILEINPNLIPAKSNKATALAEQKKYRQASKLYKEIIAADPNYYFSHLNLANIYSRQKKHNKAIESLRMAEKLDPHRHYTYSLWADVLLNLKQYDLAQEKANQAYAIKDDDAEILDTMGAIASRQGRHEEAKNYFIEAFSLEPQSKEVMGTWKETLKSLPKALRKEYVKAIEESK